MPDYREIYAHHAEQYDELVAHEDHEGNLAAALVDVAPGDALDVVETGAGTGRISRILAPRARSVRAFDGSAAMSAVAQRRLADFAHASCGVARHDALPVETDGADLAIEGWAFGHAVGWSPESWRTDVRRWVTELDRVTREGGRVVLVETMGTGVEAPYEGGHSLEPFDELVRETLGFARTVVRTDYAFESVDAAAETLGFFFGERMAARVREREWRIVPEHTAIYVRRRA